MHTHQCRSCKEEIDCDGQSDQDCDFNGYCEDCLELAED
jgi:hypothetical protein